MKPAKALTVCQGWASLMFHPTDPKDIENRVWPTSYRGELLIHAGKSKKSIAESREFCNCMGITFPSDMSLMSFGAILGIVELVGCVRDSNSPWAMPDQYHWQIANPRLFLEPIACNGALSLWTLSDEVLQQVEAAICFNPQRMSRLLKGDQL